MHANSTKSPAAIIGCGRVRALSQECGKAANLTDLIVLVMDAQAAHQHILLMHWRSGVTGASIDWVAMGSSSR